MRKILMAIALVASITAGNANAYTPPRTGSVEVCVDIGNMANRAIFDRYHTNNLQTSVKTVSDLQKRLVTIGDEELANSMTGVMLEFVIAAYGLPYTSDEAEQRRQAEKFIRERIGNCAKTITGSK